MLKLNTKLVVLVVINLLFITNGIILFKYKQLKCNTSLKYSGIDLSVEPAVQLHRKFKLHLVTYAGGKEVHFRNQNALLASAINQGFNILYAYNADHLDKEFQKQNKKILKQKRGSGYWLWKPYIILKTLDKMDENDVMIYIDSGYLLNKQDAYKNIDSLLQDFINDKTKSILLHKVGHSNIKYINRNLLHHMGMDNNKFRNADHIDASLIIIKNTPQARTFIEEWLSLCKQEELLTDIPSKLPEHPEFKDHRHDQAILTLLSYKYPEQCMVLEMDNPKRLDSHILHHRRRNSKVNVSLGET